MSTELQFLFYFVAFAMFLLSAGGYPARGMNLIAAGLAAWVAVPLIITLRAL